MQFEKLLRVLVVGGALLGGQSITLAGTEIEGINSLNALSQGASADGELAPIFCDSEEACPKQACGPRKVKEGFECCWGTSCDNVPN